MGGCIFLSALRGKLWRVLYRYDGKQKTLSIGKYPSISLSEARIKLEEVKALLAHGIDPSIQKKAEEEVFKAAKLQKQTFEEVARQWLETKIPTWAATHTKTVIQRLEHFVFPDLGTRAIGELEAPDFLACVRKIEARGRIELARRTAQIA